ncbi:hypothetical protein IFM89_032898 [Coptis chinensis]|uniref:C3H1-type domain-containing protein n=1 Tax=Coptis chinensis TaxID=261450 RepID=A0A835M7M1_9MAGN|nr:hypothetical protein IFM89_032898 [Coptis chinensis]
MTAVVVPLCLCIFRSVLGCSDVWGCCATMILKFRICLRFSGHLQDLRFIKLLFSTVKVTVWRVERKILVLVDESQVIERDLDTLYIPCASEQRAKSAMKTTSENSSSSTFTFESDSTNDFTHKNNWFEYQKEVIENEIEEMLIKYRNCFDYLQKVFHQVNLLQEENLKLRDEHLDLSILVSAKENDLISEKEVVVVPKVKKKDSGGEIQVEVYKQGTRKTELCNKWEETGECTYGD